MPGLPLMDSQPTKVESYTSVHRFPKKLAIIIALILITLGLAIYFGLNYRNNGSFFPSSSNSTQDSTAQKAKPTPPAAGVIAKVGDELIYQRDLDIELSAYPPTLPLEQRQALLIQKIATDSAILQGAKAEGLVPDLDQTIFNSPNKDYLQRLKTVENIQNTINQKADQITGSIVSIWFFNLGKAGPLGYDRGKELAFQKITQIHNNVKSGEMTMKQAGEAIRNDSSLAQIDASYKSNAFYDFEVNGDQPIVSNPDFNKSLRNAPIGKPTDVFLSIEDPYFVKPGLYQFGMVNNRVNSNIGSLQDWINSQVKKYEQIVY